MCSAESDDLMDDRSKTTWEFQWLCSWDEISDEQFVGQWKEWIGQWDGNHVFFEPGMVRVWLETYRGLRDIEPRFCVVRLDGGRVVLWPLVLDRGGMKNAWLKFLVPVGGYEFDYHDPILNFEPLEGFWAEFWERFIKEYRQANDGQVDYLFVPRVRGGNDGEGFVQTTCAPYLELSGFGTFEEYLAAGSKHLRQDIRRQRRRLEKLGTVKYHEYGRDEVAGAVGILPAFLDAHSARWCDAHKAADFYERLVREGLAEGYLHISILTVDAEAVSWHFGFKHHKRFYYYMPAFNSEYMAYSPGKVHLAMLLERAIDQGVEVFDFLTGDEAYKKVWTDKEESLYCLKQRDAAVRAGALDLWREKIAPWLSRIKGGR